MNYVVWYHEHLRDGHECGAKVVGSLAEAEEVVNKIMNGFLGRCMECKVFELGKEIPLTTETVEEPQPSKKTTKYRAKGRKK